MIKVHRRWRWPAILGGLVLLLASLGLIVMLRPAFRPRHRPASRLHPPRQPLTPPDSVADAYRSAVDRMGRSRWPVHLRTQRGFLGVNRLDVFAQAPGQTLLHLTYDGTTWYPPENLGPAMLGGPGAVAWGPNRLDVFMRGTDNQLWQRAWAGCGSASTRSAATSHRALR
jgi:hypothetical protein